MPKASHGLRFARLLIDPRCDALEFDYIGDRERAGSLLPESFEHGEDRGLLVPDVADRAPPDSRRKQRDAALDAHCVATERLSLDDEIAGRARVRGKLALAGIPPEAQRASSGRQG